MRETANPNEESMALSRAITDYGFQRSEDGRSLWTTIESSKFEIQLTVEAVDSLALRTGLLVGKWLVYRPREEIDDAWLKVARATFNKALGRGAKVSTREENPKKHVICIYTGNYLDLKDVGRVRGVLRNIGFTEQLCYKPDIYTYLNIYSGTTNMSPCRYRE